MSLTFLTDHDSPKMRSLDERIVREWNDRRPSAPVVLKVLDHEDMRQRLEQFLTDPRPPDVMTWFAGNRTRSLVDRGLMLDIAGMWATRDLTDAYDPRFRSLAGDDRAAYFLPTSHYWWAVYYRPSVFESLGIPPPIEKWADLQLAALALQKAGIVPFSLGARHRCPAAAWFDYLDLRINGPRFHHDLMSLRVPYTDDRVRAVFTFWQQMLEQGWFLGSPDRYDEDEAVDAVMNGEAGMTLIGSYVSDEYVSEGQLDLDFFRFPLIDQALAVGEDAPVDGYFVAGNSAAPDDAAEFLAHLGSRDVQQQTIEVLNVLPTRSDVDVSQGARHVAKGMDMLRRTEHVFQFYDLDTPWELADAGMNAFTSFLRDPARIDDLLREVDVRRRELHETSRVSNHSIARSIEGTS